jgi:hypothetical protein
LTPEIGELLPNVTIYGAPNAVPATVKDGFIERVGYMISGSQNNVLNIVRAAHAA